MTNEEALELWNNQKPYNIECPSDVAFQAAFNDLKDSIAQLQKLVDEMTAYSIKEPK